MNAGPSPCGHFVRMNILALRGAIGRETMLDLFRRGEVLPEGRTNEEELKLLAAPAVSTVRGSGR